MDYQFFRNDQYMPEAVFSGDHLALSDFFTAELAQNSQAIHSLCTAIEALEAKPLAEFVWRGKEYQLSIEQGEVCISALVLEQDVHDELPESTQLYDKAQKSECGLSDFKDVLHAWRDFIAE